MNLIEMFPTDVSYHLVDLVVLVTPQRRDALQGQDRVSYITSLYRQLESELQTREETYGGLMSRIEEITYALEELNKYFRDPVPRLSYQDANVFAQFVRYKHKEVLGNLRDLDARRNARNISKE